MRVPTQLPFNSTPHWILSIMVKPNDDIIKDEPPDRGKLSAKPKRTLPKTPIRSSINKSAMFKSRSPKPLSKDKIAKFNFKAYVKPNISQNKDNASKTKSLRSVRSSGNLSQGDPLDPLNMDLEVLRAMNKTKEILLP